jgi:hypothetical protein
MYIYIEPHAVHQARDRGLLPKHSAFEDGLRIIRLLYKLNCQNILDYIFFGNQKYALVKDIHNHKGNEYIICFKEVRNRKIVITSVWDKDIYEQHHRKFYGDTSNLELHQV